MRLQLALNVADLDEAIRFYATMFNTRPHKVRPGYANFEVTSPPLKLVLFEAPGASHRLNHLGVEATTAEEFEAETKRLANTDLSTTSPRSEVCCHAEQDKLKAHDPQGLEWEWYTITDDYPEPPAHSERQLCCEPSGSVTSGCCE